MPAHDDLGPLNGTTDRGQGPPPRRAPAEPRRDDDPPSHRRGGGGFLPRLVLAGIALFAVSFFVAPWFALEAVRSAAASHDSQALDELVDFNAVRDGLAAQLSGAPPPAPIDPLKHPLEALRQALTANAPATPRADAYLTPDALNDLLNGEAPGRPVTAKPFPRLRYWGFDRCRLAVPDPADPARQTLLTFQRRGLFTWKLSQIRLPGG